MQATRTQASGPRAPLRARRIVGVALAAFLLSCGGGGSADAGTDTLAERKREILGALADNVFLPTYRAFAEAASALETATAAYAADRSEANRAAAQQAWRDAMVKWEEAEPLAFGPAGPPPGVTSDFVGEMMLRDAIYSFPFTTPCRIDQVTLSEAIDDPDALAEQNVNVRGLDAMEYLLFSPGTEHACGAGAAIDAEWTALGPDGVIERRARYAASLAVLVSRAAVALRHAWEPSGGDFAGALRRAGQEGSPFTSAQQALNELGTALLYIDNYAKDMKLGEPAGIVMCTSGTCLDRLESRLSGASKEHLIANVRAFRRAILGGEPGGDELGLDDLLVEVGAEQRATDLARSIDAALEALEAIDGTLEEAITNDLASVTAAYEALTTMARLFKNDLFSALDIEPQGVPSDTD